MILKYMCTKTNRITNHGIALIAVFLSFAFSLPVFSGGPFHHRFARTSVTLRPVFIQLAVQAEKATTSLIYDVCEYEISDIEYKGLAEVKTILERKARLIENTLIYHAPASSTIKSEDRETYRIMAKLQYSGERFENTISYTASELNM